MRNRKKHKTIDDFSVAQLLDDFIKVDMAANGRSPQEIDDEAYIRMMLKKDALKKLERTKRIPRTQKDNMASPPQSDTIDDDIRQRFFPDISQTPTKKKSPAIEEKKPSEKKEVPEENGIVEQILDTIVVMDVSGLAARMREAVDFVQEEMGTSDAERKLTKALEEYGKPIQTAKKRTVPLVYNDNILVLKRCQNCYFCVGEKKRNDSIWCLCTNPDRFSDVEIEDSWVKSKLNIPCWKAPEE